MSISEWEKSILHDDNWLSCSHKMQGCPNYKEGYCNERAKRSDGCPVEIDYEKRREEQYEINRQEWRGRFKRTNDYDEDWIYKGNWIYCHHKMSSCKNNKEGYCNADMKKETGCKWDIQETIAKEIPITEISNNEKAKDEDSLNAGLMERLDPKNGRNILFASLHIVLGWAISFYFCFLMGLYLKSALSFMFDFNVQLSFFVILATPIWFLIMFYIVGAKRMEKMLYVIMLYFAVFSFHSVIKNHDYYHYTSSFVAIAFSIITFLLIQITWTNILRNGSCNFYERRSLYFYAHTAAFLMFIKIHGDEYYFKPFYFSYVAIFLLFLFFLHDDGNTSTKNQEK